MKLRRRDKEELITKDEVIYCLSDMQLSLQDIHVKSRIYSLPLLSDIQIALDSFDPGNDEKDKNGCSQQAFRCVAHLLGNQWPIALMEIQIESGTKHHVVMFIDDDKNIYMIEAGTKDIKPFPDVRIFYLLMP